VPVGGWPSCLPASHVWNKLVDCGSLHNRGRVKRLVSKHWARIDPRLPVLYRRCSSTV